MYTLIITYTVKVKFALNSELEVSGDSLTNVINLLNLSTQKFFPMLPAANIIIQPPEQSSINSEKNT